MILLSNLPTWTASLYCCVVPFTAVICVSVFSFCSRQILIGEPECICNILASSSSVIYIKQCAVNPGGRNLKLPAQQNHAFSVVRSFQVCRTSVRYHGVPHITAFYFNQLNETDKKKRHLPIAMK